MTETVAPLVAKTVVPSGLTATLSRISTHLDRCGDGLGGGIDHGHRVRTTVGDVGRLSVSTHRHADGGCPPTGTAAITVPVARSITETVPELELFVT